MKQPNNTLNSDQNWSWPQETWFQRRLNAIKAQEHEVRRAHPAFKLKPATGNGKKNNEEA
jgi:hypothetical protein